MTQVARVLGVLGASMVLCGTAQAQAGGTLNVMCSVQAEWCSMIQTVFAKTTGIKVNMSLKGSGEALAQIIAERANPKTDVWFGGTGDPHLQAAEQDLTLEYKSATLPQLHTWAQQPLWLGHRAPQEPSGPPWGPGAGGGRPEEKRRIWPFLLLGLLALLGLSAGVVVAFSTDGGDDAPTPVSELRVGDCLVSTDLARGLPSVGGIEVVGCAEEHDAEVFATFELADEDIADFDVDTIGARCVDGLVDAGSSLARLQQEDIEVRPLVGTEQPEVGDPVVCFLRHTDGQRLSGSIIQ